MSVIRIGNSIYVQSNRPRFGRLPNGVRYSVDAAEAAELYIRSPRLRQALASGLFVPVEGRFCLNRRAYLRDGSLTALAREHPEQCCIGFRDRFLRPIPCGMAAYSARGRYVLELAQLPGEFTERLLKTSHASEKLLSTLPPDFTGTALRLLRERGYSQAAVAELLNVDISTVYRFLHSAEPKKSFVYSLGFLLELEAPLFDDLVRKAGYQYTPTRLDNLVQMVRGIVPNPGLRYCNKVLAAAGCEKLPAQPDYWL